MANKVAELYATLGLNSTSFARGITDITKISAGSAKEIERSMKIAGNAVLAMSAGLVTSLGYLVKQQIDVADHAKKMAEKFGVSVEALTGFSHAAKLSGIDTETLGIGLKKLTKWMVENGRGGQDVKEVLFQVADSYQKMGESAARSADAQKKFGKSGTDLIPMLKDGRAGLQAAWQEAERFGLVIGRDTAEAAEQFNDNLTRLKGILTGVATQIMTANIPTMAALSRMFVEISPVAVKAGDDIAGGFSGRILIALAGLQAGMAQVVDAIKVDLQVVGALASGNFVLAAGLMAVRQGMGSTTEAVIQGAGNMNQALREWNDQIVTMHKPLGDASAGLKELGKAVKFVGFETFHADQQLQGYIETLQKLNALGIRLGDMPTQNLPNIGTLRDFGAEARKVFEDTRLPVEKLVERLADLNQLFAVGAIDMNTFTRATAQAKEQSGLLADGIGKIKDASQQMASIFVSNIGDMIVGAKSFTEALGGIAQAIQRMILQIALLEPLERFLRGFLRVGGGGGVSPINISAFTGGNALIPQFAGGGDFGPGRMITVGERGPELLFTGNQSGTVIPNGRGVGGGVTQHITIDNRGADFGTMAKTAALIARLVNERTLERMADRASRTV